MEIGIIGYLIFLGLAVAVLVYMLKVSSTKRPCPYCRTMMPKSTISCPHCHKAIPLAY